MVLWLRVAIIPLMPVLTIRNPASGEIIGDVPEASPGDVSSAITHARQAQREWSVVSVHDRCRLIGRFRKALVANAEDLATGLVQENGKPRQEALVHEIMTLVDLIWYFSRRAPHVLRPRTISLHLAKHRRSYLHYRPKGVVGVIGPWNFPLSIPIGEAVMALMAGNAVVVKPSEISPLIALKAKEIWDKAGLPSALLQVVTGGPTVGKALIEGGVNHINFTGSVASGRKVAVACAERLITCSLELGGKAPAVVCSDADLERTARALVWGAFANCGQVCASVERVYAVRSIYPPLVDRVLALTKGLRQGNPSKEEVDIGTMTFPRQIETLQNLLKDALDQGARVVTGGIRPTDGGMFFPPTVVTDVSHEMRLMREESFGPVLPIMAVDTEQEGLRLANDSDLGLTAYVFSRNVARARKIAEELDVGTVMINDVLSSHGFPETPWGGVKLSGIGRVHSDMGLLELVDVHHVNYPRFPMPRELWWYPYRESLYRLGMTVIKRFFG